MRRALGASFTFSVPAGKWGASTRRRRRRRPLESQGTFTCVNDDLEEEGQELALLQTLVGFQSVEVLSDIEEPARKFVDFCRRTSGADFSFGVPAGDVPDGR